MVENIFEGKLLPAPKDGGFHMAGHYVWCASVIEGEDGMFHMFASCWPEELGFGCNWLFNCKIAHAVSDKPEGPYEFSDYVFERRGRNYFDGMNQHNPSIKYWNGKYYLYYFGSTYAREIPKHADDISELDFLETWNCKRIGVAVADSPYGPWVRPEQPLLEPRDCSHWDCTITTNPSCAILPDGTTYMIYKSRSHVGAPLQLGVAKSDKPDGPFERLTEEPIFDFDNKDWHVEDPFIWYDEGVFHLLMKDDFKNNCGGITGELGAGVYAQSRDCIHWEIAHQPKAYSRTVQWNDGTSSVPCNLERPNLLMKGSKPTHLFLAAGDGERFWQIEGLSYSICIPIKNDSNP